MKDPLETPRCACGHSIWHHMMNGGLYPCVHPKCSECEGWREAG